MIMKIIQSNNTLRFNSYCKYYHNKYSTHSLADFPNTYVPKNVEQKWNEIWEKNNYFTVTNNQQPPLKMILPPPNITGALHLGHTLTVTIQDVLARWHRMTGHPVIWVPGFDHAGIATQLMVEKHVYKTKGINKSDISKEKFMSLISEWQNEKQHIIKHQLKALGASLDWSREYYTMNKDHNKAVVEAFVTLSDRNLLYRKKDFINWCPYLGSTISDIEVKQIYISEKTKLQIPGYKKLITFGEMAYVAFPLKNSTHEIIVATTRPETLFGDVAIAVHPEDERYAKYIGQQVWHALRETYIPVIADSLVDKERGTGAVKITPAHNALDYIIGMNHGLDIIEVIDKYGNITDVGKQFKHLPRFIAREKVLNELSNKGILENITDHAMSIPICSRSQDIVEPVLKEQWFIKCKDMAEKAVQVVKQNRLKIIPNTHEQTWYEYLDNIRDWCISRQIWWGHAIPAYYITVEGKTKWIVARTEDDARKFALKEYGSDTTLYQDQDVLDTWFSSAILPFSVMGWPKNTQDLKKYYPLTLMETGSDILFFWVARMVMLGIELTNCLPFNEVLLHGLLCDAYGKKMSKSLGNVVSPENIISGITLNDLNTKTKENYNTGIISEAIFKRMINANKKLFPRGIPECGADALRMTFCARNIKKQHINFDIMECQANKFFCNKIWQASKYAILMTDGRLYEKPTSITTIDHWILSRLSLMVDIVNDAFTQRDIHKAAATIKQFLHYEFCDFYLEATKWGFKSECKDTCISHTYCIRTCLETFLRISAPIIPYISDDLYKRLSSKFPEFRSTTSLMEVPYPLPEQFQEWRDATLDEKMNNVLNIIFDIRRIMSNMSKQVKIEVHIVTSEPEDLIFFNNIINVVKGGSRVSNISVFPENNYTAKLSCLRYVCTTSCALFIIAEDITVLKQLEDKLNKSVDIQKNQNQKIQKII